MNSDLFYSKSHTKLPIAIEEIASSSRTNSVKIVILPPELVDEETDEEQLDDDALDIDFIPAEIAGQIEVEDEIADDVENPPVIPPTKRTKFISPKLEWKKTNPRYDMPSSEGAEQRKKKVMETFCNHNPVQIFESIFDDSVLQLIVSQTILYARQKNNQIFTVSSEELKMFFGILFLTGYNCLARERLYWSLDEDIGVRCVSACMSRNRYQEIKKYIHFADNSSIDQSDRMYKVRPLMTLLNSKFQQWGIFHKNLSIDEAMVKYYGRHPTKQFIRGKPIRFGYKDWMLCSSNGYCYAFDTYCGAKHQETKSTERLPLGSKVVMQLLSYVQNPSDHIVYFDNFFTSYDLLVKLKELGFKATGTVRENRTGKPPLPSNKEFQKKERGHYDYRFENKNSILITKWKDNSVVNIGTNYDVIVPLDNVKRWSTSEKKKISVPRPHVYYSYNSGMGGVDLLDQATNNYRISIRGKKWWWVLFTHMLNVSMVNAWNIHRIAASDSMDLLYFVRNVARHYLSISRNRNRPSHDRARNPGSVPQSVVDDPVGHFPKKLKNQLRCAVCHARVRWSCKKCLKTLCIERDCFECFHSKK